MSENYQRLTLAEREEISIQLAMGESYRTIARHLDRSPSTISREYARNAGVTGYRAVMKLSLTYDRGKEMAEHKLFTRDTKMKVYFAHPQSPWEHGNMEPMKIPTD